MQDGASPHFAIPLRYYLNNNTEKNWIGRGVTINWTALTPDPIPCDIFSCGAKIFSIPIESIENLKAK